MGCGGDGKGRREEHEFGFGYMKPHAKFFLLGSRCLGYLESCMGYFGHKYARQATVQYFVFALSRGL